MHATMLRNGSIYGSTARFDTARALTEDEMRKFAPSIFATEAHESRSDKFVAIPTIEVLRGLAKEGFSPVACRQSTTRDESRKEFTKHLIRLRRLDDAKDLKVGDNVFEMMLKNGNDGTCAYDLMAGLWRIRCMNSLVTQTSTLDSVKVRHNGKNVIQDVIDGTFTVVKEADKVLAAPADWSGVNLNRDERMALAESAHVLRFGDDQENGLAKAIEPVKLLEYRRREDEATDLWTTFNVVQENVIKGGLHGRTLDANNRRRRVTTRAVKGIDQDVKLNKALWMLGERMKELKSAH